MECGHLFHLFCLQKLARTDERCPVCRKSFRRPSLRELMIFSSQDARECQLKEMSCRKCSTKFVQYHFEQGTQICPHCGCSDVQVTPDEARGEPAYFKDIRPVTDKKAIETAIENMFPPENGELSTTERLSYRLGCLDFEGNVNLGLLNTML